MMVDKPDKKSGLMTCLAKSNIPFPCCTHRIKGWNFPTCTVAFTGIPPISHFPSRQMQIKSEINSTLRYLLWNVVLLRIIQIILT
jgi:hypothetical protein